MKNENSNSIINIYMTCANPLYDVLEGISKEELNWKPGADSRSIGEMMRHLIRVDNWFLKRLEIEPFTDDPGDVEAAALLEAIKSVHQQVVGILEDCAANADLACRSPLPDAKAHETLVEIILHMAQHYLYHLAQMIYLRRAQDREWASPMKKWENATHLISAEFAVVKALFERE